MKIIKKSIWYKEQCSIWLWISFDRTIYLVSYFQHFHLDLERKSLLVVTNLTFVLIDSNLISGGGTAGAAGTSGPVRENSRGVAGASV